MPRGANLGGVGGFPITFYVFNGGVSTVALTAITANTLQLIGFCLPVPVTFNRLLYFVQTGDGANNSDIGIYNSAGTLIANIGPTLHSSTGAKNALTLQGAQTISPGRYYFAATSAGSTIAFRGTNTGIAATFFLANSTGTSALGTLPASITPAADGVNLSISPIIGFINE